MNKTSVHGSEAGSPHMPPGGAKRLPSFAGRKDSESPSKLNKKEGSFNSKAGRESKVKVAKQELKKI
jgi:hypothetical protein